MIVKDKYMCNPIEKSTLSFLLPHQTQEKNRTNIYLNFSESVRDRERVKKKAWYQLRTQFYFLMNGNYGIFSKVLTLKQQKP